MFIHINCRHTRLSFSALYKNENSSISTAFFKETGRKKSARKLKYYFRVKDFELYPTYLMKPVMPRIFLVVG